MMPKPKYDHPVIQKGAVQVFAHLTQKPMSPELKEVKTECRVCMVQSGVVVYTPEMTPKMGRYHVYGKIIL